MVHLFQVPAHQIRISTCFRCCQPPSSHGFRSGAYPGRTSSHTLPRVPEMNSWTSSRRWMGEPSQITSSRVPATRPKWTRNSCGIGGRTVWLETIVFCHTVTACPNPPKNSEFRGAIAGGFFARGDRVRALASRPASPPTTSRHCPCSSRPCKTCRAGDGPSPSSWRTSAQEFATAPDAKT